ncbi:MAG: HAD-IIIA family hydrolase [Chloroflexi bacterium]|nr:HAD-IIIA family hydrolase [Chloroflexota bacterium]
MGRAVFLDRDGVINQAIIRNGKPHPPDSVEEVVIVPEAAQAFAELKAAGFRLLVITNQPDVARGQQKREIIEAINTYLMERLPLDQIYTCYHDNKDGCECRKPQPGLILQGSREWQVDPAQSFLVGDRFKDIEAGYRAGCTTILIGEGYGEKQVATPDFRVVDLLEATKKIVVKCL